MTVEDDLLFKHSEKDEAPANQADKAYWKILIVDDDTEIHKISKLTLNHLHFDNKNLKIFHAYNSQEALKTIKDNPDIAIALLDVVMETQSSGLDLVANIREELNNHAIRIILRTGQPGETNESDIISNYDINDYVEKVDLTAQKLNTLVIANLRAYRDTIILENSHKALLLANQQLTQERERIQVTLNSIGDAVFTTDKNGFLNHMNPAAEALTGWSLSDAQGQALSTIFKIINIETRLPIQSPVEKLLAKETIIESENRTILMNKDGSECIISQKASSIKDNAGNILGGILVCRDVTIENRIEQVLRRSQKMEAIGQLTGGIAHDFNNQLGVIIGYLEFLKDFVSRDTDASKWVNVSNRAALRCIDLTRQLLSFSRTHNNNKSVIDINIQLTEMHSQLMHTITPTIDLEFNLSDDLWLTDVDPKECQDALLNLVLNARDAMPNGGQLSIETTNKHLDADFVSINPDAQIGKFIQIIISDTGVGMDALALEKIFDPFYTTKPKGRSAGLGMSMVYGFAKRFGGFITIYSEPDTGTSIRLYLPCSNANITNTENELVKKNQLLNGNETILIVDDEVDLLYLAKKYLQALGYKTYEAKNAKQALELLAKQNDVDCLFSDIVMPGGINGFELAQQTIKKYPKLKVLLTSGFTSKTVAQKEPAQFTEKILSKPYLKAELAQRLRLILDENIS